MDRAGQPFGCNKFVHPECSGSGNVERIESLNAGVQTFIVSGFSQVMCDWNPLDNGCEKRFVEFSLNGMAMEAGRR